MSVPTRRRFITAAGRTQTQAQWARELGITEQSIFARLARGWTEEDAVTRPAQQAPHYITIGRRTRTLSEWARKTGLDVKTLSRRLKAGWSPADAIKRPLRRQKRSKTVMFALANAYGRWYRFDDVSGRFVPLPDPPGDCDNICCITFQAQPFPTDSENYFTRAMNSAVTIPTGGSRRWLVDALALRTAFEGGTSVALTPA